MTTLVFIGTVGAYLWVFWALYVLVMGIYRAHLDRRLTGLAKAMALPIVAVGYCMDVLANITIASVVFLEPPQELLVTQRLARYLAECRDWRYRFASAICANLLDPFDPSGRHCTE